MCFPICCFKPFQPTHNVGLGKVIKIEYALDGCLRSIDFAESNTDSSSLCATQWIIMIARKCFCKSALTLNIAPIMAEAPSKLLQSERHHDFPLWHSFIKLCCRISGQTQIGGKTCYIIYSIRGVAARPSEVYIGNY